MAIKPIINTVYASRKLIPIAEYKGPILKLTKKEQATVQQLEKEITALELEQFNIKSYMDKTKLTSEQEDILYDKLNRLSSWIKEFRENIQNIKIERFNKQKAKSIKNKA